MFNLNIFSRHKCASLLFPLSPYTGSICVPNAHFSIQGRHTGDYRLFMIANVSIPRGSSISTSEELGLLATWKRKEVKRNWGHPDCHCARCKDPTELGTYLSAVKCKMCGDGLGYYIQTNPVQEKSPWKCTNCEEQLDHREIVAVVEELTNQLESGITSQSQAETLDHIQKCISKMKRRLHPEHFLIINAELGFCERKRIWELLLTEKRLQQSKKIEVTIEMGQHILSVADVLAPRYSHVRGLTLFSLQYNMLINLHKVHSLKMRRPIRPQISLALFREEWKYKPKHTTNKKSSSGNNLDAATRRVLNKIVEECTKYQLEVQKVFDSEPNDSDQYHAIKDMLSDNLIYNYSQTDFKLMT